MQLNDLYLYPESHYRMTKSHTGQTLMASRGEPCGVCYKEEAQWGCGKCKNAFYCSQKCLHDDWENGHREECKKIGFTILEGEMFSYLEKLAYNNLPVSGPPLDAFGMTHQYITSQAADMMDKRLKNIQRIGRGTSKTTLKSMLIHLYELEARDDILQGGSIAKEEDISQEQIERLVESQKQEHIGFFNIIRNVLAIYGSTELRLRKGTNPRRLIIGVLSNDAAMGAEYTETTTGEPIVTYDTEDGNLPASGDNLYTIARDQIDQLTEKESVRSYLKKIRDPFRAYPMNYKDLLWVYGPSIMSSRMQGTAIYAQTYSDKFQIIHAMAPENVNEDDGTVITLREYAQRIVNLIVSWFSVSFDPPDLFWLGRIFHLIQDSYSGSHLIRDERNSYRIFRILTYEDEDTAEHVKRDSIKNFLNDKTFPPPKRRRVITACMLILNEFLIAWIQIATSELELKTQERKEKDKMMEQDRLPVDFTRKQRQISERYERARRDKKNTIIRERAEKLREVFEREYFALSRFTNGDAPVGGCDPKDDASLCKQRPQTDDGDSE